MSQENGTSKEISGGFQVSGAESQRTSMGTTGGESQVTGSNEVITDRENWVGRDSAWKLTPIRDTTAGKILERLEALETKYLQYVDSHLARLKARLEEGKEDKEDFLQEANQIKSDIYHLAIAQQADQKANGNGHIN